jgi:hypothetical protein
MGPGGAIPVHAGAVGGELKKGTGVIGKPPFGRVGGGGPVPGLRSNAIAEGAALPTADAGIGSERAASRPEFESAIARRPKVKTRKLTKMLSVQLFLNILFSF